MLTNKFVPPICKLFTALFAIFVASEAVIFNDILLAFCVILDSAVVTRPVKASTVALSTFNAIWSFTTFISEFVYVLDADIASSLAVLTAKVILPSTADSSVFTLSIFLSAASTNSLAFADIALSKSVRAS